MLQVVEFIFHLHGIVIKGFQVASFVAIVLRVPIGGAVEPSLQAHDSFDTVRVTHGHTALAEAPATEFDLALLDLGLPDLDGIGVCRRLRRMLPSAVLVMLTVRRPLRVLPPGDPARWHPGMSSPSAWKEIGR